MFKKVARQFVFSCIALSSFSFADVGQYTDQVGGVDINVGIPEAYTFGSVSIQSSDATTRGSKITFSVPGIYRINYQLNWESADNQSRKGISTYVVKNGGTTLEGSSAYGDARKVGAAGVLGKGSNGAHFYAQLNAGDYLYYS